MSERIDSNVSANGQASLKDRVRELQLTNRLEGAKGTKSGSSTSWLPWMLCILMALAWAGVGIRWYKTNGGSGTANGPSSTSDGGAAKSKSSSDGPGKSYSDGELVLTSKGYLIPSHSIPISPIDVAGRVIELYIEEGLTFKKGEVLAVIDSTRFKADVDEAQAQVEATEARYQETEQSWKFDRDQADAELAEAKALAASAEIEYTTAKSTSMGAVSRQDLGTLLKKWESAKEHVNVMNVKRSFTFGTPREQRILAARRDLTAAVARLARAQWSLDNCTIRAPVTGVILTKKAEKDSLINPVVGGVSTSLCEIADLRELEVDLEISERDISKVEVGMTCKVRPAAHADRVYDGYVDRMMPIANRARGIIPVRVKVVLPPEEEQGKYLKPEMGVDVTFYNTVSPIWKKLMSANSKEVDEGKTAKPEPKK
jgi:HlyD family secretion protein